jgi:hypothetical protein
MLVWLAPVAGANHGTTDCPDDKKCVFPTPQECATGNENGNWDGGEPGRGSACVGAGGQVILYAGGNANAPCGAIIVANQNVSGAATGGDPADWGANPNTCP